MEEEEERDVYR